MAHSVDNFKDLEELGIDHDSNDNLTYTLNKAANHFQTLLPNVDTRTLLLYGYHKQGTEGVCNIPKPSWHDLKGKAEWEAWNKLGNMPSYDAKQLYIETIKNFDPNFLSGDAAPSGNAINKESWVRVSVPQFEDSTNESKKTLTRYVKESDYPNVANSLKNILNRRSAEGRCVIHWAADREKENIVLRNLMLPAYFISNYFSTMFGEKACTLIKELDRNEESLPPYNTELVNEVTQEMKMLIEQNRADARLNRDTPDTENLLTSTVTVRHIALQRNIRCMLAYHYNRLMQLRKMRWDFGSILPHDIKTNLSASEIDWFSKYSSNLNQYMSSLGESGLNLALNMEPPKSLNIEVICLTDYGRHELSDGTVILLKKNSRHYLPRSECEELIRQGICEHIV